FVSIQSRVPGRWFSLRMRSRAKLETSGLFAWVAQPPNVRALAPSIPLSRSRRESGLRRITNQYLSRREMKSQGKCRLEGVLPFREALKDIRRGETVNCHNFMP